MAIILSPLAQFCARGWLFTWGPVAESPAAAPGVENAVLAALPRQTAVPGRATDPVSIQTIPDSAVTDPGGIQTAPARALGQAVPGASEAYRSYALHHDVAVTAEALQSAGISLAQAYIYADALVSDSMSLPLTDLQKSNLASLRADPVAQATWSRLRPTPAEPLAATQTAQQTGPGFADSDPNRPTEQPSAAQTQISDAEKGEGQSGKRGCGSFCEENAEKNAGFSIEDGINNKVEIVDNSKNNDTINLIAAKLGVDENKIDISALPDEAQQTVLAAVRKTVSRFPKLRGHFTKIQYDPSITAIANSSSITGIVRLGSAFNKMEDGRKWYNYQVKLGVYPKGTTFDSVVIHEIGHQLDGLLTKKGVYGGYINKYGEVRTSKAIKKEVLERLGLTDERRREIRREWKSRGYSGADLNDAVKWEIDQFISSHVSDYATQNEKEFFAECFSEYMTSDNPREAAQIFGEILERVYGEVK